MELVHYFNGVGVDRDLGEARKWYRKSARQKQPGAMFTLGSISCEEGKYEEAMRWFESAVKEGHASLHLLDRQALLARSGVSIATGAMPKLSLNRRRHAAFPRPGRVLRFLRHSPSRGRAVQ